MVIFVLRLCTLNINGLKNKATEDQLKHFIKTNHIDIICLQEVNLECINFIYGYDAIVNCGDQERGTAIIYRQSLEPTDVIMSLDGRLTPATFNKKKIVNIYAPSGTQGSDGRREVSVLPHIN